MPMYKPTAQIKIADKYGAMVVVIRLNPLLFSLAIDHFTQTILPPSIKYYPPV